MHPVCFKIGSLTIHWYGVMMATGFFAGFINWIIIGKREKRDFNYCSDLLFWIMVSGIVGARLAHVISNYDEFRGQLLRVFFLHQGGLIFYGGFLGAGAAIYVFAKLRKGSVISLLDFVVTSLPLAHFFGRVGCFLNGCCHGIRTDGFLGVRYPFESQPWYLQWRVQGIIHSYERYAKPVHPVQLYEAFFNLALFFVLGWAYRRKKQDGDIIALYLLTYPVARFSLELLRGDDRVKWFGMSVAQCLSVVLFMVGLVFLWHAWNKYKERREEVDLPSSE